MQYHLSRQGQQHGPFTEQEVRQRLVSGEASMEDLAWRQGLSEWRPLHNILPPELPPALPTTSFAAAPTAAHKPAAAAGASIFPKPEPVVRNAPARRSLLWLWLSLGVLALIGLVGAGVYSTTQMVKRGGTDEVSYVPLLEDRATHQTKWKKSSFEASGPAAAPEDERLSLIRYKAPSGDLAAYLTVDPKDGKKHPAIVWAHGGFGGIDGFIWEKAIKRNDQSVRGFMDAGIVTMVPSWRGENDNPGRFELFLGEVDDFLAAIKHVKSLPYVDPQRVYIGGHSTGGTMTLLASVASDDFRAAFAFGAMVDGVAVLGDGTGYGNTPYDARTKRDHRLRSPLRYTAFIKRPTFYFEGKENDYYLAPAMIMEERAKTDQVPFHAFGLPGDHFDGLYPTTRLIAAKILADSGPACAITFTEKELGNAYQDAFANSLEARLVRWRRSEGGDLAKALAEGDREDSVPYNSEDIKAILNTVNSLAKKPMPDANVTVSMSTLSLLRGRIMSDEILVSYDDQVVGPLTAWARKRSTNSAKLSGEELKAYGLLVQCLAASDTKETTDLVIELAAQKSLAAEMSWDGVLGGYTDEQHETERLMETFHQKLPEGRVRAALIDVANSLKLKEGEGVHPFDSAEGASQLKAWLTSTDPEAVGLANSAALALAFVDEKIRKELLPLAFAYPNVLVQFEAAWSDVKHDGKRGLDFLQKACLDVHYSARAQDYLGELHRQDDIPAGAKEPEFAAQAALSRWLQHPNELHAIPTTLEVYAHRKLTWPPSEKQGEVYLLKFTYPDKAGKQKTGYGIASAEAEVMTWSSFEDYPTPPSPEELYLHHCALELERGDTKTEAGAKEEEKRAAALEALRKANPGVFDKLK